MTTQNSFQEKIKKLGRRAFITHIDGKKLLGQGYETTIWVQRDIDAILDCYAEDQKERNQKLQPILEHYRERFVNHVWMCYDNGSIFNEFLTDWMNQILEFEGLLKA